MMTDDDVVQQKTIEEQAEDDACVRKPIEKSSSRVSPEVESSVMS